MDIATIKQLVDEGKVEYVKIGASDIEGVYRGKRVAAKHFLNSLEEGFGQCDVLFGWDIGEVVPWEEHVASAICDLWTEHGEHVSISPRYVLQRVVERARALGYEALAA